MDRNNKEFKVIKDLVHGYIKIDAMEEKLIDTPHFQRLKDIRQLSAQHVYPSANHTRFEHSLGVMHLARKAFKHLEVQLNEYDDVDSERCKNLYKNLSAAALLHDIGHAPFSHLGERYYKKSEILLNLKTVIRNNNFTLDEKIFTKGSAHELMSCLVILSKFKNVISEEKLDPEIICRCIVGNKFASAEKWPENILVDLLNSPTIDIDKLDYLIRDSYMTGIGPPPIEINRLFMNIYINPNDNKITYKSNALSVIQNIIDARDSLYLWVINHHIAVYTDFLVEFYIKHLIANFEKKQFQDQLNPHKFFSCSAITEELVSDSHLYHTLKLPSKYYSYADKNENISKYTQIIYPQLFERRFLKPLWKTIYEYNIFLKEQIRDDSIIKSLTEKLCDDKNYAYRGYFATKIIKQCNLQHGEVFIIPRSNRFYSLNPKSLFTVHVGENNKLLENLLPQKRFDELYDNVAFYIFAPDGKQDQVKKEFIELAQKPLPEENEVTEKMSKLEWFEDENN